MGEREQFGRYTLLKKIAVGGMGELFLAEKPGAAGFSKQVVVKRIRPDMVHDDDFVQMFLNEGRLASMFTHPNIVQIYELDHVDGTYFMAMEYVPGRNLGDIIERLEGPLELPYALHILTQVCEGLGSAHDARDNEGRAMRLVHRDISPPNVLISFSGAVKLTDFGIAKVARQSRQTQAGVLKGKFAYLSPEQAMGEPIDRRSDLYALGLVLFEATIGRRANPGAVEVEQIYAASQGRVNQPSLHDHRYPPDLERIYLKATAKAPRDRYQSAREMHRDLVDFQGRHGMHTTANMLGAFLQRTFPEEAVAPAAAVAPAPYAVRSYDPADFADADAIDFDTLPPASAAPAPAMAGFDTSPSGYPALGRGMGFEDEEATVMEQTLPPDQLETLDSSGGLVVLSEEPSVPDLAVSYDFDEDEETRVAPPRQELLGQLDRPVPRLDLVDPTQETNSPDPRFAVGQRAAPVPSYQPVYGSLAAGYGVAPVAPVAPVTPLPTSPRAASLPPFAPPPMGAPQLAPTAPMVAAPPRPLPASSELLRPPPRVAEPAPPTVDERRQRARRRRSVLWLLLGLLLVIVLSAGAAYLAFSGGDTADAGSELPGEPKGGQRPQVSPLDES